MLGRERRVATRDHQEDARMVEPSQQRLEPRRGKIIGRRQRQHGQQPDRIDRRRRQPADMAEADRQPQQHPAPDQRQRQPGQMHDQIGQPLLPVAVMARRFRREGGVGHVVCLQRSG